ncbi:ead/Ea22-like family protein [Salmonella enterica]|nr:ead/Ea22-like family protein [Salmonella enterica]
MSNIDKQALRERYSPKPAPECHICGAEMTIQRISASRITYGCTGATYDDKGCHYAEGRSIADDHYEQSRVTVVDVSDQDVLALLDENIQLQREKDAIEAVALALRDDMRDAREKLEAAERRIAELEARTVNLPKRSVGEVMHMSGFSRDYAEGWCAGNDNAIHEIRAAGIKVKGE